jgi:hypothetical protein
MTVGTISKSGTVAVVLTVTDSRGYTASVSKNITVVAYASPKVSEISLRRTNDIETEMQLIFNGSFSPITVDSVTKNSLLYVRYRYKLTSEESYSSYSSILSAVSVSGTSFSYSNLELCDLEANSSYDFHLQICDKLSTASALNLYFVVPQGTPLLALRKQKIGINTPNPEEALHVIGNAKVEGSITADSLSGTLTTSNLSGAVPISKGGTGATTAAKACSNLGALPLSGGTLTGSLTAVGDKYVADSTFGLNMNNSDIKGLNGLFFNDTVNSGGEGIWFYRSTSTWDVLYATGGALYFAPNIEIGTYPGTRYTLYHSGSTIPLANGGTGSTTASGARSNLGIACTSLYNGTLTTGSTTFNYGGYNFYIIIGQPTSSSSRCCFVIPKAQITTTATTYQFADEANYYTFKLSYSGTTVTLAFNSRSSSGQILRVYGVN